ncbi:acyltransferase [Novosphingobium resinovorum]|uniref:acyltransferase n=1 Tax=Novosphingobium resinovorum TaxID=158500 RepID=UPI002ED13A5D|nr:acyltransferase [Novosphingobium resinovorum]
MRNDRSERDLVWPDVAKAACILLVVMMHCGDHILTLPWAHKDELARAWLAINGFVRPVRMPLFFLVSGILASNSILHPRENTERNRLVRPLYLYLAWGVAYQALIPIQDDPAWFSASLDNAFLPILLLVVLSWYLAALAIYYVFTRMTLRLPLPVVLTLCAGLSVLGTVYAPDLVGHQHKVLRCAIFFVAGVRMKEPILAFVARASPRRVLPLCVGYAVGALICLRANTFLLPVDVLAVASGASLCAIAARRVAGLTAPAAWLAQRTLPIYLLHFLILPVLAYATGRWGGPLLGNFWLGAAYPVLAVPLVVAVALAVHAALMRVRAGWLFDLPRPGRLLERVRPGRAATADVPAAPLKMAA